MGNKVTSGQLVACSESTSGLLSKQSDRCTLSWLVLDRMDQLKGSPI